MERPHKWFMDDGELTKTLCPYVPVPTTVLPIIGELDEEPNASNGKGADSQSPISEEKCCACDEAKYEVSGSVQ